MTVTNENILIKFKQIIIETISNRYELGNKYISYSLCDKLFTDLLEVVIRHIQNIDYVKFNKYFKNTNAPVLSSKFYLSYVGCIEIAFTGQRNLVTANTNFSGTEPRLALSIFKLNKGIITYKNFYNYLNSIEIKTIIFHEIAHLIQNKKYGSDIMKNSYNDKDIESIIELEACIFMTIKNASLFGKKIKNFQDLKEYLSDYNPDYLTTAIVQIFGSHHDELEINDIIQRSLKLQENIESGKPIPCGEGWTLRNLSDEEMKELMRGNCQYYNSI